MGEVMVFRWLSSAAGSASATGALEAAAARGALAGAAGVATHVPPPAFAAMRTERPPAFNSNSPMPVFWTRRIRCRNSARSNPAAAFVRFAFAGAGFTADLAADLSAARGVFFASRARAMRLQSSEQATQGQQITVRAETGHGRGS